MEFFEASHPLFPDTVLAAVAIQPLWLGARVEGFEVRLVDHWFENDRAYKVGFWVQVVAGTRILAREYVGESWSLEAVTAAAKRACRAGVERCDPGGFFVAEWA
jgi:hypothetical protein